ncbi:DUF6979 family protein [Paenibacillus elgii]|uniref:DUF6979 family protein n=1 Tax=Paenibacillus elgii TaxID=189691 RepID=UPI0013D2079D|nr:hypothetical protein [Paenibacillus elgii]
MGKYGQAALTAVNFLHSSISNSPLDAWEKATKEIFGDGSWGQIKGCPRSTFLGLCEEGLIKGVISGEYTKSKKNKGYGIKAIELISKNPSLLKSTDILWELVLDGKNISHNSQMDVVTSLWLNNLIEK